MKNYNEIEQTCIRNSDISATLVDNYLIYYCAEKEGLDNQVPKKLGQYRSIVNMMPERWPDWFMSQYIAFKLFRHNGLIKQYMNRPKILSRSTEEKEYLSFQIENPWRYTFCSVKNRPAPKFFEMMDILTNEEFLLYSLSLSEVLEQYGQVEMFFYLLGFNGQCWQTYGPHAYFRGMIPSDLLFYPRQIDPDIVFINQIPALIDRDPLPWALLWKGGELPLTLNKNDLIIMNSSEYHEENFEPDEYEDMFEIDRKYPLYKLSLKRWGRFPHFATAYYHKKKNRLILHSMTDRGYVKLTEAFAVKGFNLPENPENRVTMGMLHIAQEILGREIQLNPYEKSFSEPVTQGDSEELEKINRFTRLLIDAHNSGAEIDIERFATTAGIDIENAQRVALQVMDMVNKMPN